MKDIPVSEAPTTTILVLLLSLMKFSCFFETIEREKGASSSSVGFLSASIPPLFLNLLSRSSGSYEKFHFFFRRWGKVLILKGVNSLKISGRRVRL